MRRSSLWSILIVVGVLALVQVALAEVSAPLSITEGASTRRNLSSLQDQSVNAQAGNVTQINITAISITQSWQGYYGNVTGTIVLQDGNNATFYNWTVASVSGEVYATRNSSTDFTDVNCTNTSELSAEETALNQSASDTDSVSNTFSFGNSHPAFDVGSNSIAVDDCAATNAFDDTGSQTTQFFQVLLSDTFSNTIYTTLLNGTQTGFDGSGWDFELMVGEDGHGNSAATPYFFFVELS